jgi:hypothetical protein
MDAREMCRHGLADAHTSSVSARDLLSQPHWGARELHRHGLVGARARSTAVLQQVLHLDAALKWSISSGNTMALVLCSRTKQVAQPQVVLRLLGSFVLPAYRCDHGARLQPRAAGTSRGGAAQGRATTHR